MLAVEGISKELGGRQVLANVTFAVNRGETLGVVGPNGSGKSTLLRILAGDLRPEGGRLVLAPGARVGWLRQGYEGDPAATVAEAFPACFPGAREDDLVALSAQLAEATEPGEVARLAEAFDRAVAAVAHGTGAIDLARAFEAIGLRGIDPEIRAGTLSGGELAKLALLEAFASRPDLLLLDEPTNHLDLEGIGWLEDRLEEFAGAAIVVSHDRVLLDNCADNVLDLDPVTMKAEVFPGGYTQYADEKARRTEELWAQYRRQQRDEARLQRAISAIESRARNIENSTIDFYRRKRAMKVARRAVTLRSRLEREAQSGQHVNRPGKALEGFRTGFTPGDKGARRLIEAVDVRLEVGGRTLLDAASFTVDRGERVALVGPNGCGKTTLLRALLGEATVTGGLLALSGSAQVGYLPQAEATGPDAEAEARLTPVELLRRARPMPQADAYNFLHRFLFAHTQVATPLGRMSYGERRRFALAKLVLGGANLLLLDEPTNHLDLPSREAFEAALDSFEGAALVVTHDRRFIERFADRVLVVRDRRIVEA